MNGIALWSVIGGLGGLFAWLLTREPPRDEMVETLTPFQKKWGTNTWAITAGVTMILGLSLTATAPNYQSVTYRDLPSDVRPLDKIRNDFRMAVDGRPSSADLENIADGNTFFVQTNSDGSSRLMYVRTLPSGDYSVRAIALDKDQVFLGASPTERVPFILVDSATGKSRLNPEAVAALDRMDALANAAGSPGTGQGGSSPFHPSPYATLGAAQGHQITSTTP